MKGLRYLEFDFMYLDIAERISDISHAKRRKVACLIVKHDNIISYGYNGTLRGRNNACEDADGETKEEVAHAETNALMKALTSGMPVAGATMYMTFSPCLPCAKLIAQSLISRVVYIDEYSNKDGIIFLKEMSITVNKSEELYKEYRMKIKEQANG